MRPAGSQQRSRAVALDSARRQRRHRRREQRGPRGGRRRRALGRFSLYWALRPASLLLRFLLEAFLFLLKAFPLLAGRRASLSSLLEEEEDSLRRRRPSAAPKYAVLRTTDCSQPALADCTILHVVHMRLPAAKCSQNLIAAPAVETNVETSLLLVPGALEAAYGRALSFWPLLSQQYPHERQTTRLCAQPRRSAVARKQIGRCRQPFTSSCGSTRRRLALVGAAIPVTSTPSRGGQSWGSPYASYAVASHRAPGRYHPVEVEAAPPVRAGPLAAP